MTERSPFPVLVELERTIIRQAFREVLKLRHADLTGSMKLAKAARVFAEASERSRYVSGR